MRLLTIFRAMAIATTLALTAILLKAGQPSDPSWWPGAILFWGWIVGPAWLPYGAAKAFDTRPATIALMLVFAISTAWSGYIYYQVAFAPGSSTDALAFVFLPVWQWLGLITAIAGLAGWKRLALTPH